MTQTIADVYENPLEQTDRYRQIVRRFRQRFGEPPAFFVRAPGRVNVIGEHVDYAGYPVLPFAIPPDFVYAVGRSGSGTVTVAHVDETIPEYSCPADDMVIPPAHGFARYVGAALVGVRDLLSVSSAVNLMGHGSIPMGSGLSSSSALVCASALAMVTAANVDVPREELASTCIKAELLIGLASGGMDQTVSLLGKVGCGAHIQFLPTLAVEHVKLTSAPFVLFDSGVVSEKAVTAADCYNMRVAETRAAAALLLHAAGRLPAPVGPPPVLRTAQDAIGPLSAMLQHVAALPETIAIPQLAADLGLTVDVLTGWLLSNSVDEPLVDPDTVLVIRRRARHVYSEALRTERFVAACRAGAGAGELGRLMTESHESCRADYQCSCRELDEIVLAAIAYGAAGARLTGAGWGGHCIALLPEGLSPETFLKNLAEGTTLPVGRHPPMVVKPSTGAAVMV